jgi:Mn2+/Fe2+ NRAMP family transporter
MRKRSPLWVRIGWTVSAVCFAVATPLTALSIMFGHPSMIVSLAQDVAMIILLVVLAPMVWKHNDGN